jgi:hypothetical protein
MNLRHRNTKFLVKETRKNKCKDFHKWNTWGEEAQGKVASL